MFAEGALWLCHHILLQIPKRLTESLGLGEASNPPSNPSNIICYLNSQTGSSSWSFLCREAQRGQCQNSSHTA